MDAKLIEFATVRQLEYLEAVEKYGSQRAAAKALGVGKTSLQESLALLNKKAAAKAYSPKHNLVNPVPDPFYAKGYSQYYDKDGKPGGQWIKAAVDVDRQKEIMESALKAMCEEIPKAAPIVEPITPSNSLCNLVVFTDYHLGMLAWHKEGGADWDLKIAEALLLKSFIYLIDNAQQASMLVLCLQGDFLHTDGLLPLTPAHKHVLDADGRFPKIVDVAIRVIRKMLAHALATHKRVHLIVCEGNHDEIGSMWMRKMFSVLYENEPRLTVNESELPFYVFQWGKTMLAFHHGHKVNNGDLPILFASKFSVIWGVTTKRYGHCGHRHHSEEKEHSGIIIQQHQTLAANDAHGARHGYISERYANLTTYHKDFGRTGTVSVCPEMFVDNENK